MRLLPPSLPLYKVEYFKMLKVQKIDGTIIKSNCPIPSFEGVHNWRKVLAWDALYMYDGLTLRQLSHITNINYYSIAVLLGRWQKWHYVKSRGARPRKYRLAVRGVKWLKRWYTLFPADLKKQLVKCDND